MKTLFVSLFTLLAATMPFSNQAQAEDVDMPVSINSAYMPSGFDTDSDAYVVINGILPNGCYRLKTANVKHVGPSLHEVEAIATVFQGQCFMVMSPYNREVRLGKLGAGDNTIKMKNGDGTFWEKHVYIGD